MLSVFRRFWMCSGEGTRAVNGFISANDDLTEFKGSCPECGRVRPCDAEAKMLPHRK